MNTFALKKMLRRALLWLRDRLHLALTLLALATLMLAGTLGAGASALALRHRVKQALKATTPQSEQPQATPGETPPPPNGAPQAPGVPQPNGASPPGAPGGPPAGPATLPEEMTQLLKTKALFGRPPAMNVAFQGLLGDAALINNQWYKVGENKGGITLKEIRGNKIVLDVAGENREMDLLPSLPNQPIQPSPIFASQGQPSQPPPGMPPGGMPQGPPPGMIMPGPGMPPGMMPGMMPGGAPPPGGPHGHRPGLKVQ